MTRFREVFKTQKLAAEALYYKRFNVIFRHIWTQVLNRQKGVFHETCLYHTSVNILTKRRLKAFKRHHFRLEWEKSELSLHVENLIGLSCFLFCQARATRYLSLRQYQPCRYTMFGTRRVWHVTVSCHPCIHSHTESCILSPETEKLQCLHLLLVSSEMS